MIYRVLIVMCLVVLGCAGDKNDPQASVDKSDQLVSPFVAIDATQSGVDFSNDLYPNGDLNIIEYLYYYNGGGVALGDINNDGLDDIYLSANQKPDKLYLNLGNLKFQDISETAGISQDSTWSTGVTYVDINEDGLMDIYVSKVGNYKTLKAKNELYINKGDAKFEESAADYGLDFSGLSTQAVFFDYDQDGDQDMYLMNHSVHSTRSYGNAKMRRVRDSISGDILFENQQEKGILKFKDVTASAGIYSSSLGYGLALAVSDVNADGLLDIYVGNDFHENDYLYINQGDKTFKEASEAYFNQTSRFTMGVDFADINNDHLVDVMTLDMMPYNSEVFLKSGGEDSDKVNEIKKAFGFQQQYARNHLQINKGNSFADVALSSGVYATDWSWSPLIFDYDNDGYNDLYITNGIYKRPNDLDYIKYLSTVDFANYSRNVQDSLEIKLINSMPQLKINNVVYKNNGALNFTQVAAVSSEEGSYSNGAAYSDLDNDGDLDLVVNNLNEPATIYENTSSAHHFITINLKGKEASLNTTGAKVFVYADSLQLFKEQTTVKGFQSSSTRSLIFGLAKHQNVDSVVVLWPDRTKSIRTEVKINTIVTIDKANSEAYSPKSFLRNRLKDFDYEHIENAYLDYEWDAMMPEKLSLEGPSLVFADFNADSHNDLFIGGARNKPAVMFLNDGKGNYVKKEQPVFLSDQQYEDVDAVAIDIDGDGDLDLYALSGGNDFEEGDPMLMDRVYLNDGRGNFSKLNSKLLATNGGSVAAADYNNDGKMDLFIGNRSLPNAYGLSPFSFVLKNLGNNQFEMALKGRLGMVTDSAWADLDQDGQLELVVAGDWMPITIMSYQTDGSFVNDTAKYGLEDTEGLWNCIEIRDVDQNGSLDILAGNSGINSKWKASKEQPVTMYLDDFDGNSKLDQLIFYDFNGTAVPFASKDKLMEQLPSLKKKFLSYTSFSKVSKIEDIFEIEPDSILETKKLVELRSMLFLRKGTRFESQPLPFEAQLSTIKDFFIDQDQIFYTGNYKGSVTELGQSMANPGGLLKFENGQLVAKAQLPLPKDFVGVHIQKLNEKDYLFIGNNQKSKILEKEQLKVHDEEQNF